MLSVIAVIGKNRELGKDNHLLWHIPSDLKRFRDKTKGHPVIMGRKTYASIGHALPDRTNFVISRDGAFMGDHITVVSSLEDAVTKAKLAPGSEEIFVIGGGQIYAAAMPLADRLYLTVVDAEAAGADTFFPAYEAFSKVIESIPQEENGIHFTYVTLEK